MEGKKKEETKSKAQECIDKASKDKEACKDAYRPTADGKGIHCKICEINLSIKTSTIKGHVDSGFHKSNLEKYRLK